MLQRLQVAPQAVRQNYQQYPHECDFEGMKDTFKDWRHHRKQLSMSRLESLQREPERQLYGTVKVKPDVK